MNRNALDVEIERARIVASIAHHGQFRRDGIRPYISHPAAVAEMVEDRLKPIAWLHDVVEDTHVTISELKSLGFSDYVLEAVWKLTRNMSDTYDRYIQDKVMVNQDAIAVKIADMEHNLSCEPSEHSKAKIAKWLPILKSKLAP